MESECAPGPQKLAAVNTGRQNKREAETHFLERCDQLINQIQQLPGNSDIAGGLGRKK